MSMQFSARSSRVRHAAILVLVLLALGGLLVLGASMHDMGRLLWVRAQLQAGADTSAMAAARQMDSPRQAMLDAARRAAALRSAEGCGVTVLPGDMEYGVWDARLPSFLPTQGAGNAVRVATRCNQATGGEVPLFFAGMFGLPSAPARASAVVARVPRDIAFLVDLSGAMNDGTEPCSGVATSETWLAAFYADLGLGPFPGAEQRVGESLGVAPGANAYAEMIADSGPLAAESIARPYRIARTDSASQRKRKAYAYLIDCQLAPLMPAARPAPSSTSSYSFWEKYLDDVIQPGQREGNGASENPPAAQAGRLGSFRNTLGYRTYAQFLLDHGRDYRPDGHNATPLSRHSPLCLWHAEETAEGWMRFPPREQPLHALRRALIAALKRIGEQNVHAPSPDQQDWVSLITFDALDGGGPAIERSLTPNYRAAMEACTHLQASDDHGPSSALEAGLIAARRHLESSGRSGAHKVIILLTGGAADLYVSEPSTIDAYRHAHPGADFGDSSQYARSAALMQILQMRTPSDRWSVYPVGVGLAPHDAFLDRIARMGGTTFDRSSSPTNSTPAEYEERLTGTLQRILGDVPVRLVQ